MMLFCRYRSSRQLEETRAGELQPQGERSGPRDLAKQNQPFDTVHNIHDLL